MEKEEVKETFVWKLTSENLKPCCHILIKDAFFATDCILKPVYNNHPQDLKIVIVVQKHFCNTITERKIPINGLCSRVVFIRKWLLTMPNDYPLALKIVVVQSHFYNTGFPVIRGGYVPEKSQTGIFGLILTKISIFLVICGLCVREKSSP